MIFLVLGIAGFLAAGLGGMVGLGGGFVLVPFLHYLWPDKPAATITFISLVAIVCNAISGSISYGRHGRIDYRSGLIFSVTTIVPAVIGVYAVRNVPKQVFAPAFGALLVCASLFIIWRSLRKVRVLTEPDPAKPPAPGYTRRRFTDAFGHEHFYEFRMSTGVGSSVAAGFASSFFGIGGGLIHVPVLTQVLRWPPHIATATSNFVLAISASVGVATHLAAGDAEGSIALALCAGAGAVIGAQVAAQVARRVAGRTLMLVLAATLLAVGLEMVVKGLAGG